MNVASPHPAPKSILFVITKASWGGAQRYVYDLAVAAQDKGHEVTVACGTEGELSERLMTSHIPVLYVRGLGRDISPLADIRAFIELLRLTRAMRPDIIHANSSKAGLLATVAARLSGARHIIFTAHGWAFNEARPWWQKSIFAIFHAITIWCSDTVICVSEAVRRDASQRIPFLKNKFVVIRNGIAPTALLEKHAARMTLTERNTFPDFISGIWIGTLAELHPTKGLDTAIHAFADVAQQFQDTKLVLIGEGQDRNYLVSLVKEYNLYERVHFCGQVKNAASLLAAFDIFLFPSRSEALGFALLEAGNAHLPAIAAKVGGIPEVIEDGISGMLVPPNDVAGFSKALTTLIESPMLRKELGDVLAERVSSDFSRETMLSKTLALYEES